MLQKIRQPDGFPGAISLIAVTVGWDSCAAAVEKSEGLVRQWADPDQDALPSIAQAAKLDALYVASTGKPGPIGALLVEMTKAGQVDEAKSLPDRLIEMHGEVSDVHNAVREGMADGKVTKRERAKILTEIDQAMLALRNLQRDVKRVS